MPKDRAVCVCFDDGRVLLMRRVKNGRRYTVLPGGGVEEGETPAEAAVRELDEESGLKGTVVEHLATLQHDGRRAHYFRLTAAAGAPVLGGPEAASQRPDNRYASLWVPVADLENEPIVPAEAKAVVADAYRRTGSKTVF
jgi:8-oxo-dGTP pyrophosphatase MutT (NUDIX family)